MNFNSHHPIQHKLGVVRTLYERADNIITDPKEAENEVVHVNKALQKCGYPKWTFRKVRRDLDTREERKAAKKKKDKTRSEAETPNVTVTIPYIRGVSESLQRVFRRHGVSSTFKPHRTLRQQLVHPKDKRPPHDTAGVVYEIPCKDCDKVYVGETGRRFGVREREHKKDVEQLEGVKYTRSQRKTSLAEQHQSALTDHAAQTNHTINWEGVKLPAKEPDWRTRGIKEAIAIKKRGPNAINRDGGRHQLPDVYSGLLSAALPSGRREH